VNQIVGEIDILDVAFQAHPPAFLVGVGMVTDLVARVHDAAEKIGISLHVFAQNEKRRLGVVLLQHRQNPLRDARCGAVVEGQENPLRVVDLPDQRREQVTDYFGRLEFHDEKKYSGGVRHRQR